MIKSPAITTKKESDKQLTAKTLGPNIKDGYDCLKRKLIIFVYSLQIQTKTLYFWTKQT
jgi:hypothetical protein